MNNIDTLLSQFRVKHIGHDYLVDNMRVNRLFGLKDLIEEHLNKNMVICEIGSYEGVSSELFSFYVKKVYCVDVFVEIPYEAVFDSVCARSGNIIKIKNRSVEASKLFEDNYFDFVYIDAGHIYEEVKEDIIAWKDKVKKGGLFGGHDYHTGDSNGVIKAVGSFFSIKDIKIYEDSSWIVEI